MPMPHSCAQRGPLTRPKGDLVSIWPCHSRRVSSGSGIPRGSQVCFLPATLLNTRRVLTVGTLGRWILSIWRLKCSIEVKGPSQENN